MRTQPPEKLQNDKKLVALELIEILDRRFADFDALIFKGMEWMDILSSSDETSYSDDQIIALSAHFDTLLNLAGFDIGCLIKKRKSCKRYIKAKFGHLQPKNSIV